MPRVEDLDVWRTLVTDASAELLAAIDACDVTDVTQLARLRSRYDGALLSVAIELARARRRAAGKFPSADRLVADTEGVEQATSGIVADHKARRFADLPGRPAVLDLCCGIGGDAMSLARVADVTGVDANPVRAWMTEMNAGCATEVADVTTRTTRGQVVHLDPARRDAAGRRHHSFDDYQPGPTFIAELLGSCPDAAIKLGPGVDLDALPGGDDTEIEIINESGTLVQAVLWSGRLARHRGKRTATRLPDGLSCSGTPGRLDSDYADRFDRYLLVPDPAVERAQLVATAGAGLDLRDVHPGLGLLTAHERVTSPWFETFEVLDQLPWRQDRVRACLRDLDAGLVNVRTRDGAVDAMDAQKRLRGTGDRRLTVFGLRLGKKVVAVIAEP
ncbi:MAG: class I SAM-dependent methyltransferase [Planctomycetes bacterium]|nr:class I SAM-dependent methyltransferase [Planctomycetota bacterium]